MRVLMNNAFSRFARKAKLTDAVICNAIAIAESGLIDAHLGGGVIKQRIARPGEGKSGGIRALIAYRKGVRAVFVYGFTKNDKANIAPFELIALKELAAELLGYDEGTINKIIVAKALTEVVCDA